VRLHGDLDDDLGRRIDLEEVDVTRRRLTGWRCASFTSRAASLAVDRECRSAVLRFLRLEERALDGTGSSCDRRRALAPM
jgi:hypothetical protein